MRYFTGLLALLIVAPFCFAGELSGELKQWHTITVSFEGPDTSESAEVNPFTDYRLLVAFVRPGKMFLVSGFYAADGDAANTHADHGNVWQARFTPDRPGMWRYYAGFRTGKNIAMSIASAEGVPTAFDGETEDFWVAPTDKTGRDFRAKGRLDYVGKHYLQFAQTGEFFLKGGADSPENFLGYADFDQTPPTHRYEPHLQDARDTDPTWDGGKGQGILGAVNYLASQNMNSIYFVTMNVAGDGKDVWPWTSPDERLRFDVSKLEQWNMVFSHMQQQGIHMHVITQETENDQLLDGGDLGLERKLYYRELIARFGHHLALTWNLGEENTNTPDQLREFCDFFTTLDAYNHPLVCHTFPGQYGKIYEPMLGLKTFHGASLQMVPNHVHVETKKWLTRSRMAGQPWVVCLDEITSADAGVVPDADDPQHDMPRMLALWGNLMAGGAGAEWYFGYKYPHNDLNCEDWRSREIMWQQTSHALNFFQKYLPFEEMSSDDALISHPDGYCLAIPGEIYAAYLPSVEQGYTIDLGGDIQTYTVRWYDPRNGGDLQTGSIETISQPGRQPIGMPPNAPERDWAVIVSRTATGESSK